MTHDPTSSNGSNGGTNGHSLHHFQAVAAAVASRATDSRPDSEAGVAPAGSERRDTAGTDGRRGNASSVRVSIVIPALNEGPNLRHVLSNLPDNIFEVLLVPGHSTDDTVAVARTLRPDVHVIEQTRRGKGNAMACAFAAARGDVIITLDADGSANPREIPAFIGALLSGADFAKGTRFVVGGGSHDMTGLRKFGNWALTKLANTLHGTQYTDLCYGYNAFWRRCLTQLDVEIDGFEVETLLNLSAAKSGLRVIEVASFELDRIHGVSNLKTFRDGWRVLVTILREWVPREHRVPHTPPPRTLNAGRRHSARRRSRDRVE
jgi:glycosyltransferase involved in cell wall biosynthesis